MTIVPVQPEDKQQIMSLFKQDEEARRIWPNSICNRYWWLYTSHRGKQEYWDKMVEENVIIGFVHWRVRKTGWKYIDELLVAQEKRGQGIGRLLIEHVGRPVYLKTDPNSEAVKFYLKLGFLPGESMETSYGARMIFSLEQS
jgi:GNAT superfamily N-acetyltransferase